MGVRLFKIIFNAFANGDPLLICWTLYSQKLDTLCYQQWRPDHLRSFFLTEYRRVLNLHIAGMALRTLTVKIFAIPKNLRIYTKLISHHNTSTLWTLETIKSRISLSFERTAVFDIKYEWDLWSESTYLMSLRSEINQITVNAYCSPIGVDKNRLCGRWQRLPPSSWSTLISDVVSDTIKCSVFSTCQFPCGDYRRQGKYETSGAIVAMTMRTANHFVII